jgi:hypothetical protein
MKVTVVPAQVTTVEDRIAGSLGLSQLMLLAAPVFGGCALFVVLPPVFHSAVYKLVIIAILFFTCALLAIRIKGKILLLWLVVLVRYNIRPRYYVFNKRSLHGRDEYASASATEPEERQTTVARTARKALSLSTAEVVKLQNLLENPAANLSFETRKGNLYVRITEVK